MVIPIRRQEIMGNMGKIFYVSSKLDKPSKGKKTWGGIGRPSERLSPDSSEREKMKSKCLRLLNFYVTGTEYHFP